MCYMDNASNPNRNVSLKFPARNRIWFWNCQFRFVIHHTHTYMEIYLEGHFFLFFFGSFFLFSWLLAFGFCWLSSTDHAEIAADAHVQNALPRVPLEPAADGTTHAITMFWRARRACVADAVERLYQQHLQADATNADALAALFHSLPVAWPVQAHDFGVTLDLVFAHELELWRQRAVESAYAETTIVDAWNSQLDVAKLLPYFLAVVCMFAERAGIAREFPFAFMLALAPWVCRQDLHACFNARRPEHKVRPRFFMTLIAESNCGKSPFFRQCLDAVFVSHSGTRPCVTDTFRDRFVVPGPGKDKTLFLQTCTGSDFTKRMKATRGHLCWLSGVL